MATEEEIAAAMEEILATATATGAGETFAVPCRTRAQSIAVNRLIGLNRVRVVGVGVRAREVTVEPVWSWIVRKGA